MAGFGNLGAAGQGYIDAQSKLAYGNMARMQQAEFYRRIQEEDRQRKARGAAASGIFGNDTGPMPGPPQGGMQLGQSPLGAPMPPQMLQPQIPQAPMPGQPSVPGGQPPPGPGAGGPVPMGPPPGAPSGAGAPPPMPQPSPMVPQGQQQPPMQQPGMQPQGMQQPPPFAPGGSMDLKTLAARIMAKNPNIDNETLFNAVHQAQTLLNPQGKMELQYYLRQMQIEMAQNKLDQAREMFDQKEKRIKELADQNEQMKRDLETERQKGATGRTAMQQAGAGARTAATVEGAAERTAAQQAGAGERTDKNVAARERGQDIRADSVALQQKVKTELGEKGLDLKGKQIENLKAYREEVVRLKNAGLTQRAAELQAKEHIAAAVDATRQRGQDIRAKTAGEAEAGRADRATTAEIGRDARQDKSIEATAGKAARTDETQRRAQDLRAAAAGVRSDASGNVAGKKASVAEYNQAGTELRGHVAKLRDIEAEIRSLDMGGTPTMSLKRPELVVQRDVLRAKRDAVLQKMMAARAKDPSLPRPSELGGPTKEAAGGQAGAPKVGDTVTDPKSGKKFKVTGFDKDGTPLGEPVQ